MGLHLSLSTPETLAEGAGVGNDLVGLSSMLSRRGVLSSSVLSLYATARGSIKSQRGGVNLKSLSGNVR